MLYRKSLATFVLFGLAAAPLPARTRRGDRLFAQGRQAELKKQYDVALDFYEQALSEDPEDYGYQINMNRTRFQAGQTHVEQGLKLRKDGKTAAALVEFEKGYTIDPSSSIAEQEIRTTRAILDAEKKKGAEVKPEDRGLSAAEIAANATQDRLNRMESVPELKPLSSRPFDLKMNNQPAKVLFETVCKIAGINVMFDPDIPAGGKNLSVEFNSSTIEEALDYLSTLTKTFWKPLSPNTIWVSQDNTTKHRDYDDQIVRVFYLKNVNTAQELQEIATDVRTVCDIRRLFTYTAQMALIVRAEADKVALAEKIIHDLDKPKAEVLIDILVLSHNTDNSRNLAFGLSDGINSPITFNGTAPPASGTGTPTTTPTGTGTSPTGTPTATPGSGTPAPTTGGIPLNQIQHLSTGQYSVILPNANFQATLSRSNTKVLQSPQVRVTNNAKAILKIGQKVPTASGSYQAGIATVGVSPLVNTQFTFLDVGVNVEITPTIHGADEVSLHVDMDISEVDQYINLGGINQPVVGQRKVTFDVRMKEGQVNMLGGLMQVNESDSSSGTPGLADIPILGHLFKSKITDKSTSELIFVLIPHIVRAQELTAENLKGVDSGSDTNVRLRYQPRQITEPIPVPAATQPAVAPPVPAPATPPVVKPPATAPPATAPPATAPPATAPPATVPPATAPPATAPPSGGTARLSFAPSAAEGQLGSAITVPLLIENASDLFTTPLHLKFDPKVVRLNDVVPGGLLTSDGKPILPPSKNILNDTGEATVTLTRAPGAGGVSGSGTLVTFVFQAVGKGSTTVSLEGMAMRDSKLNQIQAAPPRLTVTVK
jgi:general secretion pathway protein D